MGFLSNLTGGSQKKALSEANANATRYLGLGYNEAKDALNTGYGKAFGYIDPFVQQGQADQTMYRNALGLNGSSGSATAMGAYGNARNPYAAYQQDQTTNALMRSYNARGMGMGGTAAMAAARANNEQGYGDYTNWLARLQGLGQQGYGAATTAAGLAQGHGQGLADLGWGYNNALAGNAINYGNARAQMATASANGIMNGLGGLLGTAVSGFAPTASGMSAFGNMSRGMNFV